MLTCVGKYAYFRGIWLPWELFRHRRVTDAQNCCSVVIMNLYQMSYAHRQWPSSTGDTRFLLRLVVSRWTELTQLHTTRYWSRVSMSRPEWLQFVNCSSVQISSSVVNELLVFHGNYVHIFPKLRRRKSQIFGPHRDWLREKMHTQSRLQGYFRWVNGTWIWTAPACDDGTELYDSWGFVQSDAWNWLTDSCASVRVTLLLATS